MNYGLADQFERVPSGTLASEAVPLCDALDLDGDGLVDASRSWALSFTESPSKQGQFSAYVYLQSSECNGNADWQDYLEFSYQIYTANFSFNRIDGEVTSVARVGLTVQGIDYLNGATACEKNDWLLNDAVSAELCTSAVASSPSFYHLDAQSPRRLIGESVKGLYIYLPPYFTYDIGYDGQRPDATAIANYNGSALLGDPLYVSTP